jgi:hypothetical protein
MLTGSLLRLQPRRLLKIEPRAPKTCGDKRDLLHFRPIRSKVHAFDTGILTEICILSLLLHCPRSTFVSGKEIRGPTYPCCALYSCGW